MPAYLKGRPPPKPPSPKPVAVPKKPSPPVAKKPSPDVKPRAAAKLSKKANMLSALASSMGVRANLAWFEEAEKASVTGKGEEDFGALMSERASAFGHADLDKDGKLDFDEFCAMVKFRETTQYTEKQLRARFDDLDEDGSGKVDLPEFMAFSLREALRRSKGRAVDLFRIWDEDGSGYIDVNEFGKAVVALGFVAGRHDVKRLFDTFDEDRSGQIDYKEMAAVLRKGNGSASDPKPGMGRVSPRPPPVNTPSPSVRRSTGSAGSAK